MTAEVAIARNIAHQLLDIVLDVLNSLRFT